jgi:hypothetical protein
MLKYMNKLSKKPQGNEANTLLPPVYSFKGWGDIDCQKPRKNGEYLCVVKYLNDETYHYIVIEYMRGIGFVIPFDNIDLLLWTELPPHPFS